MAKIAFILLCHKDPEAIIQQAEQLTAMGDCMAIHFDARAKPEHYQKIRAALDGNPNVTFAKKRIKCGWGEWSLVEATLYAVEAAVDAFPRCTHFYMLSGDCMAIKSAKYAHEFLDAEDVDYVESFDYFESDWIKTGMKEERLIYRHWFNERTQKWRFYTSFELQKRFNLTREVPADLQIMIGSQWWCLRRRTIEWILDFTRQRPDVMRFFRTTWIPDETFFQTLVRHLVPETEIRTRTLTFLMFSDYGMPVTFYNDHYEMLLNQDFLFARKISPGAKDLKQKLGVLYANDDADFSISNEGRSLFRFLVDRGRNGRRFAPRFWETESSLGPERELLIVTCKKWHVAKRLLDKARQVTNIPMIEYVFDEEGTPLPDLGGIQRSLAKRTRHRRAVVRLLFEYYETDRLILCLDPGNIELMQDFFSDRSKTKMLEIDCEFTDDYLIGHAKRVGLAGERTTQETIDNLLPTIRGDVIFESDRIRDANFPATFRMRQKNSAAENAEPLAEFLDIPLDKAQEIAETPYLFVD
ncbi:beta-1,6-N-acetylglucosaminyltransferase [Pseudoruegeria sp. SHC-113]|uniref:beta-1,6-N-acetylglucosaminyltransferase n=1 Tax=Pseudoruegeria sp. SHC-113 TaxID=2855439 RepID=UPI0021BACA3B|nr:beta-1,6-N-acetylglucosaminyltransferase [Pseudoruegeria sp. SHC-113]MCT8158853.1 beta-1,6-N-acetylglucosaminyltransferase [Pseudoruegeria sp. SHC-113]